MSAQSIIRHTLAASCLLAISASALAAPFWTGYRGTIADSTIPAIINDHKYTVNLIFDNGGDTANNQTWTEEHLMCMVWYMNDNNNVFFVQDLKHPNANFFAKGQITSDATGELSGLFSMFGTDNSTGIAGAGAGSYVGYGLSGLLTEPYLGAPETGVPGKVFIANANNNYASSFGDQAGEISLTDFTRWGKVKPFDGWGIEKNERFSQMKSCFAPGTQLTPDTVAPVPSLGLPALALLGLGAAALGGLRLRRNKR